MQAAEIHARLANSWPHVLAQLGIPEDALRNRHGPCPACGGKDRYRFDNKRGRGDFFCSHCGGPNRQGGSGDGFALLERVHGWSFSEARQRVMDAAGLAGASSSNWIPPIHRAAIPEAVPDMRVLRMRKDRCRIESCDEAIDYLASRGLWPLPGGCTLAAHAAADYWHGPQRIGRYSALLADVVDLNGELVTVHVSYLKDGRKLEQPDPDATAKDPRTLACRKILSGLTGRKGCAVRLIPASDVLGIAEGIETALSAAVLDGIPVWAALNTSLLGKFEPPPETQRLVIYADADVPGLVTACRLMERLQSRIRAGLTVETRIPPLAGTDWNDTLLARNRRSTGEDPSP